MVESLTRPYLAWECAQMAIGEGRKRMQITLDEDLVNEIDAVCKKAHMSRSAWIEYTLGMAINSYRDLIDSMRDAMAQGIGEGVEIADE